MKNIINREQPFQVLATNFSIGPSTSGYDLQISADGINFTTLFSVGANVTRMVTGVSSGSFYRLSGNTDEDVVVNWQRQCNDGQGGGGTGPQGPMGPQGPQGPAGSGSSVGAYKIELSNSNPDDFTEEDIANLNAFHTAALADPSIVDGAYVAIADDVFRLTLYHIDENETSNYDFVYGYVGVTKDINFEFENGEYSNAQLYVWNGNYLTPNDFPTDPVEGTIANYDDGQGNIGLYRYDGENWQPYGGGEGGEGVVYVSHLSDSKAVAAPVGTLVVVNYESGSYAHMTWANRVFTMDYANLDEDVKLSVWEYYSTYFTLYSDADNEFYIVASRSGESDVNYPITGTSGTLTLDNMAGRSVSVTYTNDEGQLVMTFNQSVNSQFLGAFDEAVDHNIYIKTSGGTIASWNGYTDIHQTNSFEIVYDDIYDFISFCDGKIMFSVRYQYGGNTRYAYMDAGQQAIVYYSDSAKTAEVTRIYYLGNPVRIEAETYSSSRYVWVEWKEDGVYFYNKQSNTPFENLIDFHTEGVHYHRISDPTKATASDLGLGSSTQTGFPLWNNEGIIVGRDSEKKTKGVQFNFGSNTYSYMANIVLASGDSYMPSRMYVPTSTGATGDVLTFAGVDAAPVWETRIKAVKITSDAYEALAVKDPNTLYLIVDE